MSVVCSANIFPICRKLFLLSCQILFINSNSQNKYINFLSFFFSFICLFPSWHNEKNFQYCLTKHLHLLFHIYIFNQSVIYFFWNEVKHFLMWLRWCFITIYWRSLFPYFYAVLFLPYVITSYLSGLFLGSMFCYINLILYILFLFFFYLWFILELLSEIILLH